MSGNEVIWATSTTGDDFQCVHVDDWREAQKRIAELEEALRAIAGTDEGRKHLDYVRRGIGTATPTGKAWLSVLQIVEKG